MQVIEQRAEFENVLAAAVASERTILQEGGLGAGEKCSSSREKYYIAYARRAISVIIQNFVVLYTEEFFSFTIFRIQLRNMHISPLRDFIISYEQTNTYTILVTLGCFFIVTDYPPY